MQIIKASAVKEIKGLSMDVPINVQSEMTVLTLSGPWHPRKTEHKTLI